MKIIDLVKATLVCGSGSFIIYTFPVVGQVVLIGLMSLLWLFYARQVVTSLKHQ